MNLQASAGMRKTGVTSLTNARLESDTDGIGSEAIWD